MGSNHREKIVISVGGSLVVPNGGIDTEFLIKFNKFIRTRLAENKKRQFFLIAGGGSTTRHYQNAGRKVIGDKLTHDDLDWLGIHATRLNAHLIRTIFRDVAHPYILKHYEIIRKVEEPVVVGSGWKPGWSTDFCAVMVCEDYQVKNILNLSNITQVYNKDPKQFPDAYPIEKTSWEEFQEIVGEEWVPGMNTPFDPVAAKKAREMGIKVVILKGDDFESLEKFFAGE